MITVYINKEKLSIQVKGHTEKIVCARISTLMQYTITLFDETVFKSYTIIDGFSEIIFNEKAITIFFKLLEQIYNLKKMYKNNIIIIEDKCEVKNE